jgi:hypothetical protein
MNILRTAVDLTNSESNYSKGIILLMKLCLKFMYNFVSLSSFVRSKINDCFLIILHPEYPLNAFQSPEYEDNEGMDDKIK